MIGLFSRKLDDNHLALLSLFLKPRGLDTESWQDQWSVTLGRSYKKAIRDFIKSDLLTEADTEHKLDIGFRVADLKPVLERRGLKVTGKKAELIARLIENESMEAEQLASGVECYVCTPSGATLAGAYREGVELRQLEAEREVRTELHQANVAQAAKIAGAFRASLPAPMAGRIAGTETNTTEAQAFLAMNSVPGMTREEVAEAKVQAAEDTIWGRRLGVPQEFMAAAYTAMFRASNQADLKRLKERGVSQVDVLAAPNSCRSCKRLAAKGPYPISSVPVLPNPECTHSIGWCRCAYLPVYEWAADL